MTSADHAPGPGPDPAPAESYRILRSRLDLSGWPPLSRAVTEHVIHATAAFDALFRIASVQETPDGQ